MNYDPWAPDLSAKEPSDPIEVLPARYKTASKPVLDALSGALQAHMTAHDDAAGYAAAQSDVLRATERYLDGLAEDEGQVRASNELDENFRARIIAWNNVVTRSAIAETVSAGLSGITDGEAVLIDPILDGWYVDNGASVWSSHVWTESGGGVPNYPDRLYTLRPNSGLLDAQPIPDAAADGRCFGILIPEIDNTIVELMWVGDLQGCRCFVEDGTAQNPGEMAFTSSYSLEPIEVCQAIVNSIESMRAHGVRWFLLDDARL